MASEIADQEREDVAAVEEMWYVPLGQPIREGWMVFSLDFVLARLQGCVSEPQAMKRTVAWVIIGTIVRFFMAVAQVLFMLLAWMPIISSVLETIARNFTRNEFGFFLRSCYWKARLKHLGADTIIDQGVAIWGPSNVTIGAHCHLDTNVRLASGERRHRQHGSITIGNYVHLGPGVHIAGRGGVEIRDFVGVMANAHLYSATGVVERPEDPGQLISMSHMAPHDQQHIVEGLIVIEEFAFVGMLTLIMPGIRVGRGAVIHPNSQLRHDVPAFANIGGVPPGRQIGWRKPRRLSPHLDRRGPAERARYTPVFISVIVPMRNEISHIEPCLRSLLGQVYPADLMEIIVADGMSDDGSREVVERLAREDSRLRLIDNPELFVPTALNRAIREAKGKYVIRADTHAEYAKDYVRQCVYYSVTTGADNVGGPLITLPGADTLMARCIAAMTSHQIVVGGSRFRSTMKEGYTDTCVFGSWPSDLFERIGYFNEALIRHQDNEFNSRILRYGGQIFQTPKISVRYYNQATLRGLLRQAFRNGKWHVLALIGNLSSFKFRYFAPFGFDCWLLGFALLSLVNPIFHWPLLAAIGIYAFMAVLVTLQISGSHGWAVACLVPSSMFCYHMVYGLGSLAGVVRFGIFGRDARRRAQEGSRPPAAKRSVPATIEMSQGQG